MSPVPGSDCFRRAFAFFSARERVGFDFNLRLELELFELLVFACLLDRFFVLEVLLCSSPSRAMELEMARQSMVENTSANLMILISSKNREPMMCRS